MVLRIYQVYMFFLTNDIHAAGAQGCVSTRRRGAFMAQKTWGPAEASRAPAAGVTLTFPSRDEALAGKPANKASSLECSPSI